MKVRQINEELFSYIKQSPDSYHAVATTSHMLEENGFSLLRETEAWDLLPGHAYYVIRNGSALFAFRMPKDSTIYPTFQIIASHSDSPNFKLKDNCEIQVEGHYTKLNVERYGGSLLAPWFDRPLSLAGRVFFKEGNAIKSRLVHIDRDLAMIVNLAIHMNRSVNSGYTYKIQTDMLPLIGGGNPEFTIRRLIAEELNVEDASILSMDLSLFNRMDGTVWGAENEFLSAPRLDDLQCAFLSVKALLGPCRDDMLPAAVIFDSEEVGSQSRQGACSTFLKDCLERIRIALGASAETHLRSLAGSFLLSADNGHALHPNYQQKSDPSNHPYLNGGVLLKHAANQKYTTDGLTGSIFSLLCKEHDIPCQEFFNHSDEPGGSTLGNLSMSQISIPTADIGVGLLAMHSPYETGGCMDTLYLFETMQAFYQTRIAGQPDGSFQLLS